VPILEAAAGYASPIEFPASLDHAQCIGRGPTRLLESVEGKGAVRNGGEVGQLVDSKVLGQLLAGYDLTAER
jgi:hypothetical protein